MQKYSVEISDEIKKKIVEFDIDKKNLLRDVISKQTGSLNKAIKELFQNSFDAKATQIDVILDYNSLRFIDNGCGMNNEEIDKFFRVFGCTLKRCDDTKTGAFGMGRGQVFSFGVVSWKTQNYIMTVNIRKSLDYVLEETDDYVDGTDITIEFYRNLRSWEISNIIYQVKRDILPPPGVIIRFDEKVYAPLVERFEDFSNDKYAVFISNMHTSTIFNGYLSVRDIVNSNYKYSIMPLNKLDLNFARNEFIENSQSTKDLFDFIYNIEELMASQKNRFNMREALNVIDLLAGKRIKLSSVYDKKIVPLSNEKLISFKELIEEPNMGVLFGEKDIWADDCLRQDYKVISQSIAVRIKRIKENFNLRELKFLNKSTKELSKKGFHKKIELLELKKNIQYYYMAVELNQYIFNRALRVEDVIDLREVGVGASDVANAWTDGYSYICINKSCIERYRNKEEAMLSLWAILCHEYSHTDINTKEDYHNYEFYELYEDTVRITLPYLSHCLRYITRKFLKEKYRF